MELAGDLGLGDSSLHRYLDGDFWSLKNELHSFFGSCPLFWPRYDLSLDEMRALTVQRMKFALRMPLFKRALQDLAKKSKNFVSRTLVIGEVVTIVDVATSVKCGVTYWLFGGTILNLGSPRHVTEWLPALQEQKYTGMFAMTERGHGSNVKRIQTEATFDFATQEFVIDTPCENAQKMYIGNAMSGNYAAVFAQLLINGRSQGPHCFIVPVRDENGNLYPGVTVIDMMYKEGLNGVDNGILIFDKVRIPRENLLDKFGSVTPDGQYHSSIKNKNTRFNVMLAALTPSRLAVAFQALGSMKLGLTIAIRYSHSRRQFGPEDKEEVKIIEHQTHSLRLMPHLATVLALTFASRYAGALLDEDIFQGKELTRSRSLQALVAGLKAYSTWENIHCLQDCRECTGGMGYMMENRISGLKCDTDVLVTFEGDNIVLLQVVARELLAQYAKQYKEKRLFALLQSWGTPAMDWLRTSFLAFNRDTIDQFTFLLKAVNFRERVLQRSLVARIYYKVVNKHEDFFFAWNSCLYHVTSLSLAYTHRVTLEQFSLAVQSCPDPVDQALLMKFCLLYGTKLVFQERAWYLEHKYLSPLASVRIRNQLLHLCDSVKNDALRVVSAFNIPHTILRAPTAGIPDPQASGASYPAPAEPPAGQEARAQRPEQRAKL